MLALLSVLVSAVLMAQVPEAMTFQSVIRTATGELATNKAITLQISILQGSVSGQAVYVENLSGKTNTNGLITLHLGRGTAVSGSLAEIDWSDGPYFLQVGVDVNGGFDFTTQSTTQLLSVPYALYAKSAESVSGTIPYSQLTDVPAAVGFDGEYASLSGKPELATVATSGQYADLNGTPELATVATSGKYADLDGKPELAAVATSGKYADIDGKPELSAVATTGQYADLSGAPALAQVATTGSYNDLTDRPSLSADGTFSGAYADLAGKPNIADSIAKYGFDGDYNSLKNKPELSQVAFSGSYNDLTDKPVITSGGGAAGVADYNDLINRPNFRDSVEKYAPGATNDYLLLSNKPVFADSISAYGLLNYNMLQNRPNIHDSVASYAFSGEYYDLKNRPSIVDSITRYGFSGSWKDLMDMPEATQTGTIMYYDQSLGAWRTLAPGKTGDILMIGNEGSLTWVNAAFVAQNIANTDMIEVKVNNYPDAQHRYTVTESTGLMTADGKLLAPAFHDVSYEIRPLEGWGVKSVLINGEDLDSLYSTENNITFLEFTPDTTTDAYIIDIVLESVKVKYIVSMETSPGVFANDTVIVSVGYNCDFTTAVLSQSGYGLASVMVDDVDVTAQVRNLNMITIKSVTSELKVMAVYKKGLYSIGDIYYDTTTGKAVGIIYDVAPGGRQAKMINVKQAMYNAQYTWNEADSVATSAGAGWYLPAVNEMEAIFTALEIINAKLTELKGMPVSLNNVQLWTANEDTDDFAFLYDMRGGFVEGIAKSSQAVVIAIKQIDLDKQ